MKMYTSKSNAKRAAKKAMGKDSVEGRHWTLLERNGQFGFIPATGLMPGQKLPGNTQTSSRKDTPHKIADASHVKRGFMKQFADYVAKQGTVTREQMVQHFKIMERKRVLHYWYWSKSHGILVPAA